MPLPQVYGLFSLSEEPVRAIEVRDGMLLCFTLVAQDSNPNNNQPLHRYNSSLYVKTDEIDKWKKRLEAGRVFLVSGGEWKMTQKEDFKNPIPGLKLKTSNFKVLKTPWWAEDSPEE